MSTSPDVLAGSPDVGKVELAGAPGLTYYLIKPNPSKIPVADQ